jgi:hypothetical protein
MNQDPPSPPPNLPRRRFLQATAATGLFQIVAPHVLGGPKHTPPSETFGAALIGVGGRGPGTYKDLSRKHKLAIRDIAQCDVKWVGQVDDKPASPTSAGSSNSRTSTSSPSPPRPTGTP